MQTCNKASAQGQIAAGAFCTPECLGNALPCFVVVAVTVAVPLVVTVVVTVVVSDVACHVLLCFAVVVVAVALLLLMLFLLLLLCCCFTVFCSGCCR